jgi:PKD repeat protein
MARIFPVLIAGMLFLLAWSAGCSESSDTGTMIPTPTTQPVQAKFVKGDIIAKTASSPDQFRMILKYDRLTEKYERAVVYKKPDGGWFRNNEKSEFVDRSSTEKIFPVKAGHVSSLTMVPVETLNPVPQTTPEKSSTPIPRTLSPQSLSKTDPAAQFNASPLRGQVPLTVQFTDLSDSAGTSSYAWDVNNDGIPEYTTQNPRHTYTAPGKFTVKLTVTNTSGSSRETKTDYIAVSSSPVLTGVCYGAEACNPTGNPIGGGAGYSGIISGTEANVKYVVSTKTELLTALKSAKAGETVFVKGTAAIDLTGTPDVTIPAGVTLASDRGRAGSSGALLKRTRNVNGGWEEPMFIVGGDNVRVTGLRLQGEMYPQDYGNKDDETDESEYLVGIYAENRKGFEVDNCEMFGWAWSCVSLRQNSIAPIPYIHHNYIHHNQARGEGYGVNLYGGNALIEANIFDYNRHAITGAGHTGEKYEARYNLILGNGDAIGGHHFDVHQDEDGGDFAGDKYLIHHNTFRDGTGINGGKLAGVGIRQRPTTGVYIDHNLFEAVSTETEGGVPVWERDSDENMFVTDNYWDGTLYADDEIVWYR